MIRYDAFSKQYIIFKTYKTCKNSGYAVENFEGFDFIPDFEINIREELHYRLNFLKIQPNYLQQYKNNLDN
jgi:hypothetical protein